MVMGRGVDLIVFFSVHSPNAFIISTVVFTIQLSLIGEGPRKGIFLGAMLRKRGCGELTGTWKGKTMGRPSWVMIQ